MFIHDIQNVHSQITISFFHYSKVNVCLVKTCVDRFFMDGVWTCRVSSKADVWVEASQVSVYSGSGTRIDLRQ